jgi:hypothetical protein
MTGEPLGGIQLEIVGRNCEGFGCNYYPLETVTDNQGRFEIISSLNFDRWDEVRLDSEEYIIRELEFPVAVDACGEHFTQIGLHRLANLQVNIIDSPEVWATSINLRTEFRTQASRDMRDLTESIQITVLEEIPNDIYVYYHNEFQGLLSIDTISVSVPRGITEVLEIAM